MTHKDRHQHGEHLTGRDILPEGSIRYTRPDHQSVDWFVNQMIDLALHDYAFSPAS